MKKKDVKYYSTSDSIKTAVTTAGCVLIIESVNSIIPVATIDESNQIEFEKVNYFPNCQLNDTDFSKIIESSNKQINGNEAVFSDEDYLALRNMIKNKKQLFAKSNRRLMKLSKDIKFI